MKTDDFSFSSLDAGEYSLSAYDDNFVYWHQRLSLEAGQSIRNIQVALSRGGRIAGRLLDEFGRPPLRGLLTLLCQGERHGRFGMINDPPVPLGVKVEEVNINADNKTEAKGMDCGIFNYSRCEQGSYVALLLRLLESSLQLL